MPMATYGERQRQRRWRRFTTNMILVVVATVIIFALGRYAYQKGTDLARTDVVQREQEITTLSDRLRQMETENNELHGELAAEKVRVQDLRQQYERDVPTGAIRQLLELARKKLADGVDVARLAFVVGAAENTRDCKTQSATRRFLVKTPIYQGANDSVSFAANTITVTATGPSATDEAGNPEAWFDPAKPMVRPSGQTDQRAIRPDRRRPIERARHPALAPLRGDQRSRAQILDHRRQPRFRQCHRHRMQLSLTARPAVNGLFKHIR